MIARIPRVAAKIRGRLEGENDVAMVDLPRLGCFLFRIVLCCGLNNEIECSNNATARGGSFDKGSFS